VDVNWIENVASGTDEDTSRTVSQKFNIPTGNYLHFANSGTEGFYAITTSQTAPIQSSSDWINVNTLAGFIGGALANDATSIINGFAIKLDSGSSSTTTYTDSEYVAIDVGDIDGTTADPVLKNNTSDDWFVTTGSNLSYNRAMYIRNSDTDPWLNIHPADDGDRGPFVAILQPGASIGHSGGYTATYWVLKGTATTTPSTQSPLSAQGTIYVIKAIPDTVANPTLTVVSPLTATVDGVNKTNTAFSPLVGDIEIGIGQTNTITLDDVQMFNFRSKVGVSKGYMESNDILAIYRGSLPISFDPSVKFVELKYSSAIANVPSDAEDSVNGTIYIDWENKKIKQSSLKKDGGNSHQSHWYESVGAESNGEIMFNSSEGTTGTPEGTTQLEGIVIDWDSRQITGLPLYIRDSGGSVAYKYDWQYIFRDLTNSGSFGSAGNGGGGSGAAFGTVWTSVERDFGECAIGGTSGGINSQTTTYTNDTGYYLSINLTTDGDDGRHTVYCVFGDVDYFAPAGVGNLLGDESLIVVDSYNTGTSVAANFGSGSVIVPPGKKYTFFAVQGNSGGIGVINFWELRGPAGSTDGGAGSSLIKYGEMSIGRIGNQTNDIIPTVGDFTTVADDTQDGNTNDDTFVCTFNTPLDNNNYNVVFEVVSNGVVDSDNTLRYPVLIDKTSTGFVFNVEHAGGDPSPTDSDHQINARIESNEVGLGSIGGLKDPNHTTVDTFDVTTSFQDLDLSSIVGSNKAQVTMEVYDGDTGCNLFFRRKGSVTDPYVIENNAGWGASSVTTGPSNDGGIVTVVTDSSGVTEYRSDFTSTGVKYKVLTYQVIS
jgi:hypothetical protein